MAIRAAVATGVTPPPVLLIGIDTPIGLAIVRELGERGVPVHGVGRDPYPLAAASRWIAAAHPRPHGAIGDWLPALIAKTGAAAVFAIAEDDLVQLADLPDMLAGCRLLTPRRGPLATVLDKACTLARARALAIDTPESWQPANGDDIARRAAGLRYPVVVKWADPVAMWGRLDACGLPFVKAEYAGDRRALIAILDRYEALGDWPLVQEYCPGYGLGQMFHMAAGRATLAFQHRRLGEWPPEGGISTLCAAVPPDRHPKLLAQSEALLADIGWEGVAMVEYRHDPATGRSMLMEINGRFWGSYPLARVCGAAFAWEAYRRGILDDRRPASMPRMDRRARYLGPDARRLGRILFAPETIADPAFVRQPAREIARFLANCIDPRVRHYVWDWRDPAPMLRDVRAMAAKLPWDRLSPTARRRLRSA